MYRCGKNSNNKHNMARAYAINKLLVTLSTRKCRRCLVLVLSYQNDMTSQWHHMAKLFSCLSQ